MTEQEYNKLKYSSEIIGVDDLNNPLRYKFFCECPPTLPMQRYPSVKLARLDGNIWWFLQISKPCFLNNFITMSPIQ
jgi:hypothetical protein